METAVYVEQSRVRVTVVSVRGEFDSVSAHEMERCAQVLIAAGARHLLINLAECTYLGRPGIVAIDHILQLLLTHPPGQDLDRIGMGIRAGRYKSPEVKIVNASPDTREELHRSGIDMYLEIHRNLHQAIASFGPGSVSEGKAGDDPHRAANHWRDWLAAIQSHIPGRIGRPSQALDGFH